MSDHVKRDPVERETYDIEPACRVIGIGPTTGRKKVREGRLPVLRVGRRVLITKATIEAILRGDIDLNAPPPDRHDLPPAQ